MSLLLIKVYYYFISDELRERLTIDDIQQIIW